ncbi:Trans-zeatin O-beta-D-glucosyltransferase [Bertholletia excelsa]
MATHHDGLLDPLKQRQVTVVMVPFPAQGHLNQLLHLSRLISSYQVPVHYVGSSIHNRQAKVRVHGWNPISVSNIQFHDFPMPFLSPPPDLTAPIKFPAHLQSAFEAISHLRQPVAELIRKLSATARRVIVVHDDLMASVIQDVAVIPNAESYSFHSTSAFFTSIYLWETMGKPFSIDGDILKDLPSLDGSLTPEFMEFVEFQFQFLNHKSAGDIINSNRTIEGPFLDLLSKEPIAMNTKKWAFGPFNPVAVLPFERFSSRHKSLEWLDKQPPNSVIYVSFGTTTSLTDEQIRELAEGLDKSGQKFIWVLRDADKGDVFDGMCRRAELPEGYEEKVQSKGIVVRDWAPQLEILQHRSTGGFMTHCGWNSCMESITTGVPIVTWPMHSDQPRNSFMLTKLLKVGLCLKDWRRRDELVTASMIEEVVRRLMASEEGDEVRKRAEEMGQAVRASMNQGGVSRMELESFIAHISR